jgi:hypothetical protein
MRRKQWRKIIQQVENVKRQLYELLIPLKPVILK